MRKVFTPTEVLGLISGWGRMLQPFIYGTWLKIRYRGDTREVEAVAPFDSRIRFQHIVLKGRDAFLFHRDHDALDQLTGGLVFRRRQIDVWIDALKARDAWCRAHDARMRLMIIPEKHVVYADKLPKFVRISPSRPVKQIFAAADADLAKTMLYPVDALRAAGSRMNTFLKTDTHWTSFGAFIAYRALVDSLAADLSLETVSEDELTWRERPFTGDLGVRFSRERTETIAIANEVASYHVTFQNHNFARGAVHVYENERRDLPRCVLFRDSFSNALIPFLMRGFSRIVAVSSMSCHYDLLEQEKPDVVLFVVIERFVATFGTSSTIELPRDDSGMSFAEFTGTDLELLRRSDA